MSYTNTSLYISNLTDSFSFFVVTGASRGYAFVEYETEREMRRAYEVQCLC